MFDRQQSIGDSLAVDLSATDVTLPANNPTRAVYFGGGGDVVMELALMPVGTTVTYTVLAGSRHSLRVRKFVKAGTTATGIRAEF